MWKVANLDPQYCANMVPLIFVQEWGHFFVIFAYKILKWCNFYWKIIKFWPLFLHKLTGMWVCAKMAHQIIPHTGPLKDQLQPVLDQSLNFSKI